MSIMKRTTVALTILVYSFVILGCSGSDEGVIKATKAQEVRVTNIALERFEVFIDKLKENPKYAQITANPNFKALILPYFKNIVRFAKYSGATDSQINTYCYDQKRMMYAAAENWVREWIKEHPSVVYNYERSNSTDMGEAVKQNMRQQTKNKSSGIVVKNTPRKAKLFLSIEPVNSRIFITNVNQHFYQGIELKPGRYNLEISDNGYKSKTIFVSLGIGEVKHVRVTLSKIIEDDVSITVVDEKNQLVWKTGPSANISFRKARRWVESLTVNSGGWKLPTLEQLSTLCKESEHDASLQPLFEHYTSYVWFGDRKKAKVGMFYMRSGGNIVWTNPDSINFAKVFAVCKITDNLK